MKKSTPIIEPPRFDRDGYQTNLRDLNGEPLPDLAAAKFTRLHGGARSGAGRRPLGKTTMLLHLRPQAAAAIRTTARREHQTLSAVVDRLVTAHLTAAGPRQRRKNFDASGARW
ncbi:MAG: hypothetical protein LBD30_00240 [Verrucomicrobiales bacterium]|jgi:hypothetical protein|nr:hypothetical protein [Verrucomicrobiales bacterium]